MSTTPKYSRLDPGQRREQILEAANALFAERGYDEVRSRTSPTAPASAGARAPLLRRARRSTSRCSTARRRARGTTAAAAAAAPAHAWPTASRAASTGPSRTADLARHAGRGEASPTPTSDKELPTPYAAPSRSSPPSTPRSQTTRHGCATHSSAGPHSTAPNETLAASRGHPRADPRTDRLHARARPTHLRRPPEPNRHTTPP